MMILMILMILSILFGAALGMRFKVLVLFPAIFVTLALVAGFGATYGKGMWPTVLAMVLSVTCLQMGYLGGTVARSVIAAA
jgi:hypothetical protein